MQDQTITTTAEASADWQAEAALHHLQLASDIVHRMWADAIREPEKLDPVAVVGASHALHRAAAALDLIRGTRVGAARDLIDLSTSDL